MAEVPQQEAVNKVIDEGGSALEEALKSAISTAEGTVPAPAEKQQDAADGKGDKSDANDEADGDDSSEDEGDKPESKEKTDEDADATKDAKDGDERSKDKHQSRAAKKASKLLDQRNSARDAAAEAAKAVEAKEARIKELEAELETKRGEKPADAGDDSDTVDVDEEEDASDLDTKIDKALEKRDASKERDRRKADLDKQERDTLVSKFSPTAEELAEVEEIIKRHPTLSDAAALRIAAPHHFTDAAVAARANARKQAVGAGAQRGLREEKSPDQMSTQELEKHLKGEHQAGRLSV